MRPRSGSGRRCFPLGGHRQFGRRVASLSFQSYRDQLCQQFRCLRANGTELHQAVTKDVHVGDQTREVGVQPEQHQLIGQSAGASSSAVPAADVRHAG
ncbi:hypothetical protein BC342_24120 [Streptomyces olivaceus]|nr:hypothetical protein BC342_24120 [Streptomyces olivaceus]